MEVARVIDDEKATLLANAQRIGRMGAWSLDLRSGRVVCSEATYDLFGIKPNECSETIDDFYSLILTGDRPVYDAAQSLVSPVDPLMEAEYRIRRPDGAIRWLLERGEVEFDDAGKPIGRPIRLKRSYADLQ